MGKRARWGPYAALVALVALFLGESLVTGRVPALRDALFDALPWREFAADALADGRVPLWNPYSRFGQPFLASPRAAVLYPPHLLFSLLPIGIAFRLNILLHLSLTACSAFALFRHWRLHVGAAFLGAIALAFGGHMTANLEFTGVMETLAWAPLTLLLTSRLLDRMSGIGVQKRGGAATTVGGLALVLALQTLPGRPHYVAFTLVAVFLYVMCRSLSLRDVRAGLWTIGFGALALVLAAGLCLPQLLPTRELLGESIRAAGTDPGLDIGSLPPRHLLSLILPFAHGHPGASTWWAPAPFEFWLGSMHVGLPALILATLAPLLRSREGGPRRDLVVFGGVLCGVGLLLALGGYTPVYGWLLDIVPGLDRVRWPAKALCLVALGLALLSALGLHSLLAARDASRRSHMLTLAVWSLLAALAAGLWLFAGPGVLGGLAGPGFPGTADAAATVEKDLGITALFLSLGVLAGLAVLSRRLRVEAAAAAVLAVAFANLALHAREMVASIDDVVVSERPAALDTLPDADARVWIHPRLTLAQFAAYGRRDSRSYEAARDVLAGETSLPYRVRKTYGGDALHISRARVLTDLLDDPSVADHVADSVADVCAVRWALVPDAASTDSADARWVERPTAFPRAYVTRVWDVADGDRAALQRVHAGSPAVVDAEMDPPMMSGASNEPVSRAEIVVDDPERVLVRASTPSAALLVLTDTWFPGWSARRDGEEVTMHRVNVNFRGVFLPAGDHEIEFVYASRAFRRGLWIGAVALLLVLGLLLSPRLTAARAAAEQ